MHGEVLARHQGAFDRIGDRRLVMGLTGDIDQSCGGIDNIGREIKGRSHVDTVSA